MTHKNNLLSIGDMAKLTGASIKSLRYYEQINILKPAYIDPDSKYRYYTFNQVILAGIIRACIEFDIPLKKLAEFVDSDDTVNFKKLLSYGKENAKKKIKAMEKGLKFIDIIEREIDQAGQHKIGQIYSREMTEKFYYVKPCGNTTKEIDQLEIIMEILDLPFAEEELDEINEYGFLCEYASNGINYYTFIQLPGYIANENIITIPAGVYFCRQDKDSQIEQAAEIFKEYVTGRDSFLAIEAGIFTDQFNISQQINELRVIAG